MSRRFKFPGVTKLTRFPPYVFGTAGTATLVHKVEHAEIHWSDIDGKIQNKPLIVSAKTVCGYSFLIEHHRSKRKRAEFCVLPNPDAVLCGRCHGTGVTFKERNKGPNGITIREAHQRLGCISEGTLTAA